MASTSLRKIGMILGGEIFPDFPIRGFATDSRLVTPGFVFFALKGERVDGHDFLEDIASKGAICAIVSKTFTKQIPGLYLIRVDDVLQALHKLATWKLSQEKFKACIGITGSVGKTTTKEYVATLLEGAFQVRKTPGNANSQVGVPLSILNLEEGGEVFVVEMGMSGKGNIAKLVDLVPPDLVVVTKIALAHALFFPGGIEEIAEAKAEILSHPHTKKAFINEQAQQFKAFQKEKGPEKVFYDRSNTEIQIPFEETHLAENFLAAALVAREMGMSLELIAEQSKKLNAFDRRFEKIEKEGVLYINDSYNANPESVKAALHNLPKPQEGKKTVAVLGEMRELGPFSRKAHQEIGKIASEKADLLLCLAGDCSYMAEEFSLSGKPAHFFHSLKDLQKVLHSHIEKGDVVLVKASKSLKMWEVLEDVD
jgi:UDP-N-acetylmuramoyl-tripeptide--D-alanyl-D-alanine ligase